MKLIPQDEVDKAALKYANTHAAADDGDYFTKKEFIEFAKIDFQAGVEFAESKFEELAIEFVIYCDDNYEENSTNFKELFQQFIKDRNEKN